MERAREIRELEHRLAGGGSTLDEARRRLVIARHRTLIRWTTGSKRLMDFVAAVLLLAPLTPLIVLMLLLCRGRMVHTAKLGRWAEPFDLIEFDVPAGSLARRLRLHKLPMLIQVLIGDLSWIGPRPLNPDEATPLDRAQWRRWDLRPGLLSLWWIRQRANNHYGTEWETDAEYARNSGLRGDLGVAARAIPALLYGGGAAVITEDAISVLGLRVDNLSMTESLAWIASRLGGSAPAQIRFLNADCANRAWSHAQYRAVLNQPGLTLADGIGMKLAGRLLGRPVRQNVNGTDLFPRLCAMLGQSGHGLFLLGAQPGVAGKVAAWVREHYPVIRIAGVRDGYFKPEQDDEVVDEIASSRADVLLVAFGAPRQDTWIAERLPRLNVGVAMGVGGLFDFYSGRIPRAPQWMRDMAIEWLYRFWQEPRRMWRRYFVGNVVFLFRVGLEKTGWRPWER